MQRLLLPCALFIAQHAIGAGAGPASSRKAQATASAAKAPGRRVRDRHSMFPDETVVARRERKGNLTWVVPCTNSDIALQTSAKLLPRQHRGRLAELDPSCFPPGSEYSAARCCDTKKGPGGDGACWQDGYDYQRCCPHLDPQSAEPPGDGGKAPQDRWRVGGRTRQGFGSCWPNVSS